MAEGLGAANLELCLAVAAATPGARHLASAALSPPRPYIRALLL
jgi:hypothetical protein